MDEKIRVIIKDTKARPALYFDAKQKRSLKCFTFAIGMCMVTFLHKNIMKLLYIDCF